MSADIKPYNLDRSPFKGGLRRDMKVAIIIIIIFIIIIITIYYHSHYYYYYHYYHYYYKTKLNSRGVDLIVTERINRMQIVSDDKIFLGFLLLSRCRWLGSSLLAASNQIF